MKTWKPDEAVKPEAGKQRCGNEVGGGRAEGKKHEASEERADNLGRLRKQRKQAGPNGNMGSGAKEAKAEGAR